MINGPTSIQRDSAIEAAIAESLTQFGDVELVVEATCIGQSLPAPLVYGLAKIGTFKRVLARSFSHTSLASTAPTWVSAVGRVRAEEFISVRFQDLTLATSLSKYSSHAT